MRDVFNLSPLKGSKCRHLDNNFTISCTGRVEMTTSGTASDQHEVKMTFPGQWWHHGSGGFSNNHSHPSVQPRFAIQPARLFSLRWTYFRGIWMAALQYTLPEALPKLSGFTGKTTPLFDNDTATEFWGPCRVTAVVKSSRPAVTLVGFDMHFAHKKWPWWRDRTTPATRTLCTCPVSNVNSVTFVWHALMAFSGLWPLLLSLFNFNPRMDL